MPDLSFLDSANMLNALLNAVFRGSQLLPPGNALLSNLTRLTDKSIIEYEAARASLTHYIKSESGQGFGHLFRTFDHVETCVDAVHRAGQHAESLRTLPGGPTIHLNELPSPRARTRLRLLRNAVQHSEERVLEGRTGFGTGRPATLIATNTTIVAGQKGLYIRHEWLANWIGTYYLLVRRLIR
jgi:hypothetical protein